MTQIRSYGHQLYTIKMCKIGLSPYDDKRYVLCNGRDTLAYGHYSIAQEEESLSQSAGYQ